MRSLIGISACSPDMANTCCPQYTIRLDANAFDAGKDKKLRKVLNRWKKFVIHGERGEGSGNDGHPKKG
jgi:arginine-tRNA-protein transferase